MLDIDKIYNSRTAVTYDGDSFHKEYVDFTGGDISKTWNEYTRCYFDKKYFKNSSVYKYLINKRRTETIDEML